MIPPAASPSRARLRPNPPRAHDPALGGLRLARYLLPPDKRRRQDVAEPTGEVAWRRGLRLESSRDLGKRLHVPRIRQQPKAQPKKPATSPHRAGPPVGPFSRGK